MLEDHSDLLPLFPQFSLCRVSQGSAPDQYSSCGRHLQEIHTSDQCTFSGSGHSNNSVNVSCLYGQIYIFQCIYRSIF